MLENKDDKLILGLPKGSLEAATTDLFAKAGYKIEMYASMAISLSVEVRPQ